MHKKILFIFLITVSSFSFGQTKFEKETRIKEKDVPKLALSFVDTLDFNKKVKWYKETALKTTSIEAKTKYKGKKYSIEFSTDGQIEDVEVEMKFKDVPESAKAKIMQLFTGTYKIFGVEKIQIQYTGNRNALISYLKNNKAIEAITVNYEIVINARVNKSFKRFEYLFNNKGKLLSQAEIIIKNTDNIEY